MNSHHKNKLMSLVNKAPSVLAMIVFIVGMVFSYTQVKSDIDFSNNKTLLLEEEQTSIRKEFESQYNQLNTIIKTHGTHINEIHEQQLAANEMLQLLLKSRGIKVPSRDSIIVSD